MSELKSNPEYLPPEVYLAEISLKRALFPSAFSDNRILPPSLKARRYF